MMDDAAYVQQVFPGCLQAGKKWQEVELCVKTACNNAGYAWSFSYGPDGQKAATEAYWTFQRLMGQTIFEASQKYMRERP